MTSAVVTERTGSIMNVAVQNTSVRTGGSESEFTKVMDSVSGSMNGSKEKPVSGKEQTSSGSEKDRAYDSVSETDRKAPAEEANTENQNLQKATDGQNEASKNVTNSVKSEEDVLENGEEAAATQMYQIMSEQAMDLIEQTADSLSLQISDVMEAMEQLDMNMLDILDPDQMQELALILTGEDRASLLTDENLYQVVQNLTQMSEDAGNALQEEFAVSDDVWKQLLEQAADMKKELQMQQTDVKLDALQNQGSDMTDDLKVGTTEGDGQMGQGGLLNGQADHEASAQADERFGITGTAKEQEASRGLHEEVGNGEGTHQLFADTLAEHANEMVEKLMQDDPLSESGVDVDRIMKQIMDYMKVNTGSELSEIEMQLHPQSLGTLHISMTSKNGIVTAQFAAQNEAVKEALESHVMILKENLEEQGIKVEAVEVTIASHEFERNLEQDAQKEAEQSEESEAKKKSTRRIQRDGILEEEDDENQDEAERITRDMMMRHGSSLDYLV